MQGPIYFFLFYEWAMLDYAYILIKVILTREIEGEEEGLGKREIDKGKGSY